MSHKPYFLSFVPILVVVLAIAVQAQAPPTTASHDSEVVTNADILKMVEGKLGDDIIIGKIKGSASNFDTSIDAILKLKAAGTSDAVIHAMVDATPAAKAVVKEGPAKEPAPDPNDPMSAHASGIYWKPTQGAEKRMVRLEPSSYAGSKVGGIWASGMTYGAHKAKAKAVLPGPHAALRISEPTPEFWFYFEAKSQGLSQSATEATKPEEFALSKMEASSKGRKVVVGQASVWGGATGTRPEDTISVNVQKVAPGIYKVTPGKPLPAGEYCFVPPVAPLAGGRLFDFGIDAPR